jgi:hypothetical protein
MRKPPEFPIDCFTDEQKQWAVEKLKAELPAEWQRLVNRQAHNMELYSPSEAEQAAWLLDSVRTEQAMDRLPFDYGNDGWGLNRRRTILVSLIKAAAKEAQTVFAYKPGDTPRIRKWTAEEVAAAKAFIAGRNPKLWGQLLAVEREKKDFTDLDITRKVHRLIMEFNPNPVGIDNTELWGALRKLMQQELKSVLIKRT